MAGLYVHIPFCHSKCPYCDFYSKPLRGDAMPLVSAIGAELQMRRDEPGAVNPATVYIGGGTPSSLGAEALVSLIGRLPLERALEVTVEVNPEDVTPSLLTALTGIGVNRVSMGVQSLNDTLLLAIGRRHDAAKALKAIESIRRAALTSYSIDLMYGLPGQTLAVWADTLERAMAMRPPHLSAYLLSYEPGTRMSAMLAAGKLPPQDEQLATQMYNVLCDKAFAAGYEHYEISNFALPGHRSKHNSAYWTFTPYLGLGPGAHSFDGCRTRRANAHDLTSYIKAIGERRVFYDEETEDDDTLLNDKVLTGLRTSAGVTLDVGTYRRLAPDAAPYIAGGDLIAEDSTPGHIHLTIPESRWLTSDAVISALMRV